MRILAFTDMHGSMKAFKSIKRKSKNVDLILCCGDFTIFELEMEKLLKKFDALKRPFLVIPGNHEMGDEVEDFCKQSRFLHYIDESYYETDNLIVLGAEGNGFAMKDKHFEKVAKRFNKILAKKKTKKVILMTHAPPYGTKHDLLIDEHCGNKSIRDFIKKKQPQYAVCGHIHENAYSKDKIGETITINPGPEGRIIRI